MTLTALEVVLGIDNIVFITILAGKLPPDEQARARRLGLGFALGTRVALLFAISWIMGLNRTLFSFAGRDLTSATSQATVALPLAGVMSALTSGLSFCGASVPAKSTR